MFFWEAIMGKGKKEVEIAYGFDKPIRPMTPVEALHEREGDLLVEIEDLEKQVEDLEAEVVAVKVAAFDMVRSMLEE